MTEPGDSMSESQGKPRHALGGAFDNATRWFANLLAPLVIVTYAKEAQQTVEYVIAHPIITGISAFAFIGVLGYNVFRNVEIELDWRGWRRPRPPQQTAARFPQPERPVSDREKRSKRSWGGRALLRWAMAIASVAALALVSYMYFTVFVTGIYFADLASAPDKGSALREVQTLNQFFAAQGYSDLEARAQASTATGNPSYMITIGSWYTSREAAEAALRRAKRALGPKKYQDAYIYSTKNISLTRVAIGRIRQLWASITGFFSGR